MGSFSFEGGCFRGRVRYRAEGEHGTITHCHCVNCRKSSGAPVVTWIEMPRSGFTLLSGTLAKYDQSEEVYREHCARCGSQIVYQTSARPEVVDLTVCSMDDPSSVIPQDHVWHSRRLPWLEMADQLPRYEKEGDRRA